ncbi:hypothetical protein [Caballeronia sp. DA-9]|uniref:hypothetical protein n=1 Tax=Caballeronia sp. DA-9 TaxID=3436237 RepID=UPI003F66B9A4
MKHSITAVAILFGVVGHAQADSTSSAQQSSQSQSVAQGQINFSTSPADQHLSETVRNVSAPILGAYASSFSQMNCSSTTQGGIAFAGFSAGGGSSKDSATCVLEVAAAELTRQATVDPVNHDALVRAAIGVRCQLTPEVYNAMRDAGFDCKRKPAAFVSRTDDQPASTRVAGN